jgi:broad specificity phosphatase PhoE
MKWPKELWFIRHAQSEYNILKALKLKDPLYKEFLGRFESDHRSGIARGLALQIQEKYALGVSDRNTPLTDDGKILQARPTAKALKKIASTPDVIITSTYRRVKETFTAMVDVWPELQFVERFEDERVREQEHGLSLLYNDWRVFFTIHPDQKDLYDLLGPYDYQYPQGESTLRVKDRVRSMIVTLIREFSGKVVWIFNHHLTILSFRSVFERFDEKKFIELDTNEKPVNCGITKYICNPDEGKDGKLILDFYNKKLY